MLRTPKPTDDSTMNHEQQSNSSYKLRLTTIIQFILGNQRWLPPLYPAIESLRCTQQLLQRRLNVVRRRIIFEVQGGFVYLVEWFQQNKDWIEDALTIFFSGLLAVNVLSLVRHTLIAGSKLFLPDSRYRSHKYPDIYMQRRRY